MLSTLLQADFDPAIAEEFGYTVTKGATFLGVPLIDAQNILTLLLRFGFNLLVSFIIIRCFYYRKSKRKDYFLTFMLFSSVMFLLIFMMENVNLQIGLTLGLFAIFGVIRYRTETVPIREMTYLFIVIAIAVINGLALTISYGELVLANLLLILIIWLCESNHGKKPFATKTVQYDKIDLIVPEKREELKADLEKRLGIKVLSVEVGSVDFLKDSALLKVNYDAEGDNTADEIRKFRPDMDKKA